MKPSKKISFLLLLALSPALMAFPVEGDCQVQCCDSESSPLTQNNFGDGCQDCSVPCCARSAFITPGSLLGHTALKADEPWLDASSEGPWIPADPLYHPPRG